MADDLKKKCENLKEALASIRQKAAANGDAVVWEIANTALMEN